MAEYVGDTDITLFDLHFSFLFFHFNFGGFFFFRTRKS